MTVFTEGATHSRARCIGSRYSQWMARTQQPLVSSYFMQCTLTLRAPYRGRAYARLYACAFVRALLRAKLGHELKSGGETHRRVSLVVHAADIRRGPYYVIGERYY